MASISEPAMLFEIFVSERFATAVVIPAAAPASWNFTATVLPSLKIDEPSALIGCRIPLHGTTTLTTKLDVATLPAASVAVHVTVVLPSANVLPEGGVHVTTTLPSTASTAGIVYVTTPPVALVAIVVSGTGGVSIAGAVVSA